MWKVLIKVAYLKFKYAHFPNSAQKFWGQELVNAQGLSAKLGQVLGQGVNYNTPQSSLSKKKLEEIFNRFFNARIIPFGNVYAASMGQVFFVFIEEEAYALKILHPGIKTKIKNEIKNIIFLGKYFSKINGFTLNEEVFQRFLTTTFEEETDLVREASYQEKFHHIFETDKRFKIPLVIKKFSNEYFLCQELVESNLAFNLTEIPQFHIFDFFFISLFQHGVLHGDLNDRNWGMLDGGTVVIYDYGCTQIISERRVSGLTKLLLNHDVVNAFKEVGMRLEATWFKGKEQDLRDTLFQSLLSDPILPGWSYSKTLKDKYGEKIKILREYTDPWILLMMRSLFSLIRIYQTKGIPVPLQKIIQPYLKLKDENMSASNIKIEVTENNKQIVYMILPITSLDNLQDLMPEKVTNKVLEDGLNINSIIQKVKDTDFLPQDLFCLQIVERKYHVWID